MKTAEERKIARLEKQVQTLKTEVERLNRVVEHRESSLGYERQWRQDFQRLMKAAALEDTVEDYHWY